MHRSTNVLISALDLEPHLVTAPAIHQNDAAPFGSGTACTLWVLFLPENSHKNSEHYTGSSLLK
jgi:hypothetical protein